MKFHAGFKLAAIAASIAIPALGLSQAISVIVNGEAVAFSGVGPQEINGRVLVPLRAIMEKLGAYVGYDVATRTVTANKSGIDLMLRLGDQDATLNGRTVHLDVPAQEIRGNTMVPLRFVGEALGANVTWDAPSATVNIATSDVSVDTNQYSPPTQTGRDVRIRSFDLDQHGTIRNGQEIRFTLMGTPGGQATFSIPGIVDDVQMHETDPGTYVGTFRIPQDSRVNLSRVRAIGKLTVGNIDRMTESSLDLGFDNEAPLLTEFSPDDGSRLGSRRAMITATFDDRGGTGIDPQSFRMRIDGRDVTSNAKIEGGRISYRPDTQFGAGRHDVIVQASDLAGNQVEKRWSFDIISDRDAITEFTLEGDDADRVPGATTRFTMVGEPGGRAVFSIGDRVVDRPMREISPGHYEGTYVVRNDDDFINTPVRVRLTTGDGSTYTYNADRSFTTRVPLEAPVITEPVDGDKVSDAFVIRGRAHPGSRVHVKVDYDRTELKIVKLTGTVLDTDVFADREGHWETEAIDIRHGFSRGTRFSVTATTYGPHDRRSAETKMVLHH